MLLVPLYALGSQAELKNHIFARSFGNPRNLRYHSALNGTLAISPGKANLSPMMKVDPLKIDEFRLVNAIDIWVWVKIDPPEDGRF